MSELQEIIAVQNKDIWSVKQTVFNNGKYVGLLKGLCSDAIHSVCWSNLRDPHGVHYEKEYYLTFNQPSLRCAVSIYIHTHATLLVMEYLPK